MNSIRKGKRGERDIVKLLEKITKVGWKRVPCSGALFTSQGSEQFKGDAYSDDPSYKDIVIEVKNHKGFVPISDFASPKSELNRWLRQLAEEAGSQRSVLFFKSGHRWCWITRNISANDSFYLQLVSFSKAYMTTLGVM